MATVFCQRCEHTHNESEDGAIHACPECGKADSLTEDFELGNVPRYEVQTLFIHAWENCWTEDGEPLTFPSRTAARKALSEYLRECRQAVKDGHMLDAPRYAEHRVVRTFETTESPN